MADESSPSAISLLCIIMACTIPRLSDGFCSKDHIGEAGYPYKQFHGATLYDTVRGEIGISDRTSGCTPESVVLIARHGSRHPGKAASDSYRQLVELQSILNITGKATLCKDDLTKIIEWRNWYQASLDQDLAVTGIAEMKGLGQRFAAVYPELFSNHQGQRFISSNFQRTKESARVFRNASLLSQRYEIDIDNFITMSWENCTAVGRRKLGRKVSRFLNGKLVGKIGKNIAARLGVPPQNVRTPFIPTIYMEGCAREQWATGKDSPWCLALSRLDKEALEYSRDMRDYMKRSFGHVNSYRHSCVLKHYILSALKNASSQALSNEQKTNHFIFAHKPTLLSLLTEMKMIEDEGPFRGRDFRSKLNRKFKMSNLIPGSGNVAFVLNKCDDQMKLQIFHNERLLTMPLHGNPRHDGLWNLDDALEYFGFNDPHDCIWEEICS